MKAWTIEHQSEIAFGTVWTLSVMMGVAVNILALMMKGTTQ